jgi:hypothetical protein
VLQTGDRPLAQSNTFLFRNCRKNCRRTKPTSSR